MTRIRGFQEADYPALVALRNAVYPEPSDEPAMRAQDLRIQADPKGRSTRLVAEDEHGRVVGFAQAMHWSEMPPKQFLILVIIGAADRGRGIGSRLLAEVEGWARDQGAEGLTGWVQGGDEPSFAWTQRQGWYLDLQRTESVLDLKGWQGDRFAHHLENVRKSGLTLLCQGELSEPLLRGAYDIEAITAPDIPEYEGHMPSYEEWRLAFLGIPRPKAIAVALDGERVIGISSLVLPTVPGAGGYTFYTGVLKEYRGRGIALALKLLTIEAAVEAGLPHLRTNNDEENPAMLAVNERLGYRMVPGPRRIKKLL